MKTINNYIDKVAPEFVSIVIKLRSIIKQSLPGITEKISYNIPFYYYEGPLCYINVRKNYVDLGFAKGFALSNKQGLLDMKDRKQVASLRYYLEENIDKTIIQELLIEAASVNELQSLTKKR